MTDQEPSAPEPSKEEPTAEARSSRRPEPAVVGVGASAGGLRALQELFAHVPQDSGLAWVVIVHLSPKHESHLAELLQPHVSMPVEQVAETVPLVRDHVYVIPPNANLNTIDSHLRLSELEEERRQRAPVDHFFRTLAATHDGQAIGIVLSGTGSDGALGLKEIKEKGGLTVAQDPDEAEYDGMPRSAVATGLVDLVLPVAEIADAVLRFAKTEPRLPLAEETSEEEEVADRVLHKVFAQLRARTDRDFSRYKRSTVMRRIARRMQLHQVPELADYVELLRSEPEEVLALADDLLITVTDFFRDSETFRFLEDEVVPKLFQGKGPEDSVRVWSVGCSTGEEAYSLAILLLERAARLDAPPRIQVFASDLHERSLERARHGFYAAEIEADVGRERLHRYFRREDGGFRVAQEVREVVVFAPHNLLADPPFSRLDLVSCRNLLIYLQREIQSDVVELFHYALRPEGFLVLGSSETVGTPELFLPLGAKRSIYRKRNVPAPEPNLPVFPLARPRHLASQAEAGARPQEPIRYGGLHQRIVEQYGPPSVLVGPDHKVVHLSENAGRYLVHPGGEPTASATKLVLPELRLELASALRSASEKRRATRSRPIEVKLGGERRSVVLDVRPALEPAQDGFVLVLFDEREEERRAPATGEGDGETAHLERHERARLHEAEAELDLTRQRLQAVIEEYETSQEEMKASNEELQSANEELRSTMEELETSKEELQSMNEELQTVNQENRNKVEELGRLSSDLQNLLSSTDIATLFLDRQLRILRFTPKVGELFNVRQTDRGRPISDLTHRLGYDGLVADAESVLRDLVPVEREVQDEEGRWYLGRVLPYRSGDDRIEGVVITLVEITGIKRAEAALRESEERFRALVTASSEVLFRMSPDWSEMRQLHSQGFLAETIEPSRTWLEEYIPEEHRKRVRAAIDEAVRTRDVFELEHRVRRVDGGLGWALSRAVPITGDDGELVEWFGTATDVTARKELAQDGDG